VELGARSAQHRALLAAIRAMFSLIDGQLADAEDHITVALQAGHEDRNPAIFEIHAVQLLMLRRLQGRVATLRAASQMLTTHFPEIPAWTAGLGTIYADLGRTDDARACLESLARDDFAAVRPDLFYLVTLEHAARLAHRLEDRERAVMLLERLRPFAGRLVVAGGAAVVYGAVDQTLGILCETIGDRDGAIEHLTEARRIHETLRLRPAQAWSARDLARVLQGRATLSDAERARELKAEAADIAAALGMSLDPDLDAGRYSAAGPISGLLGGALERVQREALKIGRARIKPPTDDDPDARRHWGRRTLPTALSALYRPEAACGLRHRIQLIIEQSAKEEPLTLSVIAGDDVQISRGPVDDADLTISMPQDVFIELVLGRSNGVAVWLDGSAVIDGDPALAASLIEMFAGEQAPVF
jgi:tetratricopeptide (TPR) repeat protein